MAKKPKASGKSEPIASGGEATIVQEQEVYIPVPGTGRIDFVHLFNGVGILILIVMILFFLNQLIFHIR